LPAASIARLLLFFWLWLDGCKDEQKTGLEDEVEIGHSQPVTPYCSPLLLAADSKASSVSAVAVKQLTDNSHYLTKELDKAFSGRVSCQSF